MGGSRGGAGKVAIIEEPAFVEWGAPASTAVVDSIRSRALTKTSTMTSTTSSGISTEYSSGRSESANGAPDDDGSGMAWLRKRRREREAKARQEQELTAAGANQASQLVSDLMSVPIGHPAGQAPNALILPPLLEEEEDGTLHNKEVPPSSRPSSMTTKVAASLNPTPSSGFSPLGTDLIQQSGSTNTPRSSIQESCKAGSALSIAAPSSPTGDASGDGDADKPCSQDSEEDQGREQEDDEDLDEEELRNEDLLQAKVLAESPFVKGAKEVYKE